MKIIKPFTIFIFFSLCAGNIKSQPSYKVKIVDKLGGSNKGILYNVTDSSVIIISEIDYYRFKNSIDFQKTIIPFNKIDKIRITKKGRLVRSLGIMTLAGATIGSIAGYSGGDDTEGYVTYSAKEKAVILGIGGALIGAMTGSLIGLQRSIPINKSYSEFSKVKDDLSKKAAFNLKK